MGCDIHIVVERKWEGRWIGLHAVPYMRTYERKDEEPLRSNFVSWDMKNRNYDLFAKLAGVRGDGPEPKGIPDDASELSRMEIDSWGSDGHSHSYCTVREFFDLFRECNEWAVTAELLEGSAKVSIPDLMGISYDEAYEGTAVETNYRVVFWFDN